MNHPLALARFLTALLAVCGSSAAATAPDVADGRPSSILSPSRRFTLDRGRGEVSLKTADGAPFFSLGVCCVDQGIPRAKYDTNNPGFAAWRYYDTSSEWARATLLRLTNWGLNTIGGWSDYQTLRQCPGAEVAFTPVLHMGSSAGAPWWDMWDPAITGRMEQVARDQIEALRDDPRVLGYFSDNEMGWWSADLVNLTLKQKSGSGQRARLLVLLRQIYHDDWKQLLGDFDPEGADSFEALTRGGILYLRPGGNGTRALRQFAGLLADRYYFLVREIIRKFDPHALVLGDRYQSFYYPEVARAAASFLDAASSNLNAGWNDGSFPRYFLETLHGLTGLPVMVGEFYMAARENRSGNRNSHNGFPIVPDQQDRAAGFQASLLALAQIPWVIGAHWFQYYDEPTHGRGDGEDFNFGLVDINNEPYENLTNAAARFDLAALRRQPRPIRPDASAGVPRAPTAPLSSFQPYLALKGWDRERGFVPASSPFPLADLYVCWDQSTLYFGLFAQDIVEERAYRGNSVPVQDRASWSVSIDGIPAPIRARLGAGQPAAISQPAVRIVNQSGVNLQTRNIAAMAVPATLLGKTMLKAGDTIAFTSAYVGHGGADKVQWKGSFILRDQPP